MNPTELLLRMRPRRRLRCSCASEVSSPDLAEQPLSNPLFAGCFEEPDDSGRRLRTYKRPQSVSGKALPVYMSGERDCPAFKGCAAIGLLVCTWLDGRVLLARPGSNPV